MTSYVVVYLLGVMSVVAPLGVLYAKGFFKEWVKDPVVTVSKDGIEVEPKSGEA